MKKNIISFLFILLLSIVAVAFSACGDDDSVDSWTVTYTDGDGVIKTVTVQNGESASIEPAEKVGYVFDGYYTAEGLKCFGADGKAVSGLQITAPSACARRYRRSRYKTTSLTMP